MLIPDLPDPRFDWYFITNQVDSSSMVTEIGWIPIILRDLVIENEEEDSESYYQNSMLSKDLKVFPQKYLPRAYDFVIWFDNKFDLKFDNILTAVLSWDPTVALMLHRQVQSFNIHRFSNLNLLFQR